MADIILGTSFYNQIQASRGSSASVGQQSGQSSSSGGPKQGADVATNDGSMKLSALRRTLSSLSTGNRHQTDRDGQQRQE